jgi:hypothetical protein
MTKVPEDSPEESEESNERSKEGAPPKKDDSKVENGPSPPSLIDDNDLDEILSRLPADTPPDIVQMVIGSYHSDPIPHPSTFQHYDEILPGAADRILTMAEKEQQIRGRDNGRIINNESFKIGGSIFVSI